MGNEGKTNVVKAMELNVLLNERYNELQEHLKTGEAKLANIYTLYLGALKNSQRKNHVQVPRWKC